MNCFKTGLMVAAACGFAGSAGADLIITGIFDGPLTGGLPKVIELYSNGVTDLSQYNVSSANNGGGTDGPETTLSGVAADGDFIYVVDGPTEFATYFGFTPALLFDGSFSNGGGASINGDDAIELFFAADGTFDGDETVVDVFGQISVDGTGQPWDHLDGWAYRVDGTGPDGSTFVLGNFTYSGINVNDGKTTNTDPDAFPIGTYQVPEPGSLALLGLGGLLIARRRRG